MREYWTVTEPDLIHYSRGLDNWKNLRSLVKEFANATQPRERTGKLAISFKFESACQTTAQSSYEDIGVFKMDCIAFWMLPFGKPVRKDHAPENLAMLRHIALNLIKQDTTIKREIKNKRLVAARNNNYLIHLFTG